MMNRVISILCLHLVYARCVPPLHLFCTSTVLGVSENAHLAHLTFKRKMVAPRQVQQITQQSTNIKDDGRGENEVLLSSMAQGHGRK